VTGTVVVRLPNWLGDTVMAVPALASLRAGWPEARIAAAGPWASLLAQQGLADVLVPYPRRWSARLRVADVVARLGPELAVLLPNSFEAALAAWYWGARRRIGFAAGGRSELLTDAVAVPEPRRHQVDEYLALVERCGVAASTRQPWLAPPAPESPEVEEARRLLADVGVPSPGHGRAVVGVHLGAAYGSAKLWPIARVREFCRLLLDEGEVPVLLGAPDDAPAAAAVLAAVRVPSLVGRDRPALLPALLVALAALVSGDTGVAHLAAALGTPVVALFGPTDPTLTAPRGPAATVTHPVPCSPCFYRVCPIEHPCLAGIEPHGVRAQVLSLLARAA